MNWFTLHFKLIGSEERTFLKIYFDMLLLLTWKKAFLLLNVFITVGMLCSAWLHQVLAQLVNSPWCITCRRILFLKTRICVRNQWHVMILWFPKNQQTPNLFLLCLNGSQSPESLKNARSLSTVNCTITNVTFQEFEHCCHRIDALIIRLTAKGQEHGIRYPIDRSNLLKGEFVGKLRCLSIRKCLIWMKS